jgi:hypothetical protein
MKGNRKCQICGKELVKPQGGAAYFWYINASVNITGMPIVIYGHKTCLENINNLVVLPQRTMFLTDKKKEIRITRDPKKLKIPNICFSLTKEDDEREKKYTKQRLQMGFDDSETWSLFHTISRFILPRLERFREIIISHPSDLTPEEWNKILDKMIRTFETIISKKSLMWKKDKKVEKGLRLFSKYFLHLWN